MRFPTVRITVTPAEYRVLKPGLDMLANGLADAQAGRFPHRHPWHRIDFVASDVYRDQAYDQAIADTIIKVRAKLWDLSCSRRIYVNFIESSILAFSARQLHKTIPAISKMDFRKIVRLLERKLELYRKRTKRKAISAHGKDAYDDAAANWRRFSKWMHYNLLYLKIPRRGTPHIRQSWRDKYAQMAELIKLTISERYDLVLTEAQVNRIRNLVVPSLRRGRHELTLNTVLSGSDVAKDFLIGFITKRIELNKGPGAPLNHWERYWAKTDLFAEAARRRTPNNRGFAGPLPPDHANVSPSSPPIVRCTQPHSTESKSQSSILLTDQEIIAAVCRWFVDNVEPGFREEIFQQARSQVLAYPWQYVRTSVSRSLGDLIQEGRPTIQSDQSCDYTNGYVEWLLGWMLAVRPDPKFIFGAIGCGYALTNKPAA
jgi:hypothetical protein